MLGRFLLLIVLVESIQRGFYLPVDRIGFCPAHQEELCDLELALVDSQMKGGGFPSWPNDEVRVCRGFQLGLDDL